MEEFKVEILLRGPSVSELINIRDLVGGKGIYFSREEAGEDIKKAFKVVENMSEFRIEETRVYRREVGEWKL